MARARTPSNFQQSFRRSQGRFRNTSTTISLAARSPSDEKGIRNSHLLALGYETENLIPSLRGDNGATDFMRRRNIKWWKSSRSGDDCSRNTPTRNLASSQVSCVNFLLPLADANEALDALVKAIDPTAEHVEPLVYDGFRSAVEIEWVGLHEPLEGGAATRGANVTSCDALLVAKTSNGRLAYLVEWKCCEEYKGKDGKGEGTSGDTRRRRYQHLYDLPDSSFNKTVPMDELLWEPFYQLMRMFLLGDKMRRGSEFGIDDFRVVVVCPSENVAYRNLITSPALQTRFSTASRIEQVMRQALSVPDNLRIISQRDLLNAVRASTDEPGIWEWSDYHRERYGW